MIPPADEMLKISANPQLLTAISDQTHGYHYELAQLPQLIDQLIRTDSKTGMPQQQSVPLDDVAKTLAMVAGAHLDWDSRYDLPLQGMLVIGLLILEWFLRRRWQLP